eukprot:TRINITY_DN99_c0_g1_i5.p1 TRINITY_DN99_c0_g1~~TRINITY_DN99_c0_g1_i5.p1  ORF type:complete len:607 (-),score=118.66 TRINITY_DN99_c0_g1_i5:126-1946(-)
MKEQVLIYMRDEATLLWEKANHSKALVVTGPPGVGKSILMWTWALEQSKEKKVLWIETAVMSRCAVYLGGGKITRKFPLEVGDITTSEDDILIIDGLRDSHGLEWKSSAFTWWQMHQKHRKLIIVASSKINLKFEEMFSYGVVDHLVSSWTLQEYVEACNDENIWNEIHQNLLTGYDNMYLTKDELIQRKYFLAGGSARWMFEYPKNEVEHHITNAVRQVADLTRIFSGLQGDLSAPAVNRLISVFNTPLGPTSGIVSQAVCQRISRLCDQRFITMASNQQLMKSNPAWDGWIFQIDVFSALQRAADTQSSLQLWKGDGFVPKYISDNRPEETPPKGWRMFGLDIGLVGHHSQDLKQLIAREQGEILDDFRGTLSFAIANDNDLKKEGMEASMKLQKLRSLKVPIFASTFIQKLADDPTLRNFSKARALDDFREPRNLDLEFEWNKAKYFPPQKIDPHEMPPQIVLPNTRELPITTVTWPVPHITAYKELSDLTAQDLLPNHWMMPLRWNEACYDLWQYLGNGSIRIVQVTRAHTHSLKLDWIRKLLTFVTELITSETFVEICVIVPVTELELFEIRESKVRSDLRPWGWQLKDLQVYGYIRTSKS